ncbi:c4-dicarboxylate transporter malic acid transport [Colletotrichum truncatum]|uniref:C4-dicarboxylate transporter malic acid transport n=1 Tax=Colletotrichum truncatum TaxID=5467 RepID=A0ACC3YWG6_COLTU|nr:c4-dicarboxylate transporter malic acid transport [Colletotrichum truncatum]XP_036579063.1 c4-dicarboxylate transporter malic acid transport [Colletotrichum truncatum]KAF6782832.1 c4-dicarboxylate transporter malic acid transport [Colletotrichum truncatum]KAF6786494.1 c4-dicarboxylate transporter malic acid transport [Colletotrichum truncatum]
MNNNHQTGHDLEHGVPDVRANSNGDHPGVDSSQDTPRLKYKPKPQHATLIERLHHFTWSWFACTMSTGALGVVLANTPFRFRGLDVIAKIVFVVDLVLFTLFCVAITYRFTRRPIVAIRNLHHPKEALFFGSFWVSIALILNLAQTYGVPVCGPWLPVALRVCFWTYSGCALCVAIFQYTTLFVAERLPADSAMPAWVFPVYPFLVIGPLAGVLVKTQPPEHQLSIWVGAVMFQGLGWTVTIFMYGIYVLRLMSSQLPDPSSRPGMFVSVGPAGYTSAGLVSLGNVAPSLIPDGFLSVNTMKVGDVIKVISAMSGIFLLLVAFWFFALSALAVAAAALSKKEKMEFTLNWWAFIFPNAGLCLATINVGNVLQSDGIKGVTSALTLLLVIAWLVVAVANIRAVMKGKILWEGRDEDHGMRLD